MLLEGPQLPRLQFAAWEVPHRDQIVEPQPSLVVVKSNCYENGELKQQRDLHLEEADIAFIALVMMVHVGHTQHLSI